MNNREIRDRYLAYVGSVIKKNRTKRNLTQKELGQFLEVKNSTVSRYETGDIEIPVSSLPLISSYCGFPMVDFLVTPDDEMYINTLEKIIEYQAVPDKNGKPFTLEDKDRECVKEFLAEDDSAVYRSVLGSMQPNIKSEDYMAFMEGVSEALVIEVFEKCDTQNNSNLECMKHYIEMLREKMENSK